MRASFLLLLLAVSPGLYSSPQDESCAALVKADHEVSRKFLDEQSATRHSPCITAVITRLGKARDKNSVHVLTRYLDCVDRATAPRLDGGADVRPNYPSVSTLFLINEPVTRELLSAIQTGESPKTQKNAANTYMFAQ